MINMNDANKEGYTAKEFGIKEDFSFEYIAPYIPVQYTKIIFPEYKKIYIICPVRNVTEEQQKEIDTYVEKLESFGNEVHNPKYAVDQSDKTGWGICQAHFNFMKNADEIHVFWDISSYGSHFDLGMAFALRKPVTVVKLYKEDLDNKSYVKVMKLMSSENYSKDTI